MATQSDKASAADGVREEDLRRRINPHLQNTINRIKVMSTNQTAIIELG